MFGKTRTTEKPISKDGDVNDRDVTTDAGADSGASSGSTGGVKQVLVKYVEGTSLKGLPKAYKATSHFQRWLWLAALVVGFSVGLIQVVVLLKQYLAYETTIATVDSDKSSIFPAISICNANPLSMTFDLEPDYGDVSQEIYRDILPTLIPSFSTEQLLDVSQLNDFERSIVELLTGAAYFQSLSAEDRLYLQNYTKSTIIQDCTWKPWAHEVDAAQIWCTSDDVTFDFFLHSVYGPCYTITLPPAMERDMESFAGLFYLQNAQLRAMTNFLVDPDRHFGTGLKVLLHQRDVFPDMTYAITATPGQETTMSVSMHRSTRLGSYYGSCSTEQLVSGQTHPYKESNCRSHCIQAKVQKSCGCVLASELFAMRDLDRYSFCGHGNLSDPLSTMDGALTRLQCVNDVMAGFYYDSCDCKSACDEISYESDVSQTLWPHESHHLMIYQRYILNTVPDNQRFIEVYDPILDVVSEGLNRSEDANVAMQMLADNTTLLRDNFLALNIRLDSTTEELQSEKPVLTLVQVMGTMGGVLNLWVGITFFFFVELIDLVYQLIMDKRAKLCTKVAPDDTKQ